ncbi:MAG: branched-chain amino acid ABC transporter permease [Rhodospirillales bacterium]|nr:branched-chain amino acid ABC transporter permease [Rhodospirillales bacterium]MCW8862594.1 branched-chain amino acid ABC transporter permease [Rhodospirillales bacterium]MCW8951648.1 branched-chain amino acid ABC transporter permease [Rhodospirillales bacterium]MCW8970289.1 branched-chain amino acid ABC transporter permease [Rhodospirillales bacterium]MCW9001470.1 branched-chain amino acid ABC transporter permease [Rhodospirillales bacterium]
MFYRESGQFKTSYQTDQAIFPIAQDRWFVYAILAIAVFVVPFYIDDYWANAIFLPFLIYALAAMGLNILTGYCGQLSLGTGGFMAVGAYATYKLMTMFPEMNFILIILLSGGITAMVGILFGIPSLRIKGFYLAVATLAAQFFLVWLFNKVGWFYNYSASGQISATRMVMFGFQITGPEAAPAVKYLFCLGFVLVFGLIAKNIARGRIGRAWMAIRDMDIAAEIIGIKPLDAKLGAFAVSSFYIGMSGSLYFAVWLGAAEVGEAFGISQSFLILFIVIIGGLGTVLGSFLGAAFMVLMPILLKNFMVDGLSIMAVTAKHVEIMLMGTMIIIFLIVEPHGFARLWQITKEKLRLWPFPH